MYHNYLLSDLALVLHFLRGPSHYVDMRWRQANRSVHWYVLGGAIGSKYPHVGLIKYKEFKLLDIGRILAALLFQTLPALTYLVDEGFEEVGLVSERVMYQAVAEWDDAIREVMLGEPGNNTLLLHVRTTCDIHYQIAQVLPVPANNKE